MKYVKIKAKTYNEAMMKLKMEYGDDAIPVSHKYIKEGGMFSSKLFARDVVELTSAIPERKKIIRDKHVNSSPLEKNSIDFTIGDSNVSDIIKNNTIQKMSPTIQDNCIHDILNKGHSNTDSVSNPLRNSSNIVKKDSIQKTSELLKSSGDIKQKSRTELSSILTLEKEFHEIKETLNALLKAQNKDDQFVPKHKSEEDKLIEPYLRILRDNEFGREDCNSIIEEVKNSICKDDLHDRYKIEKTLKDLLKNKIITSGPIKKGIKKKVIMFIGPTGVGKTTTMAKLGAIYSLRENFKVTFVTIDTYRIAATEQLKKYAGIMKIPVHIVNEQNNFKEVIDKEKADIIMVDTSGRSHKDESKISEIKSYVDMVEYDFEKILCVSANIKKSDLEDVFKAFDKINFNSIIITKVDETSYIGSVIDIADKYKKPISFYTNGQEVPNDIALANPDKIADMIVGGNLL